LWARVTGSFKRVVFAPVDALETATAQSTWCCELSKNASAVTVWIAGAEGVWVWWHYRFMCFAEKAEKI
jgi:hypothetical protein